MQTGNSFMCKKYIHTVTNYFLVFTAAIPFIFLLFILIQQKTIQIKMKEKLEAAALHKVMIHENNIHWLKTGKEILLNGKMFDIHHIELKNNIYNITGLYDEEETTLCELIQKEQDTNPLRTKHLAFVFQLLDTLFNNNSSATSFVEKNAVIKLANKALILRKVYITIPTPPPQA
jgi:hypothetical protein